MSELSLVLKVRSHMLLLIPTSLALVCVKQINTAGTQLTKPDPLHRLQSHVNNTHREMMNSRSGQRLNAGAKKRENWFHLLNVKPIKQGQRGSLPSGRDAVNLLCAEPRCLYKNGCTSTDGLQREDTSAAHCGSAARINHNTAPAPKCRARGAGCVGDFF